MTRAASIASREQMASEFEAIARTTPESAAEIIHTGVDAGKPRILVGPDAYLFDWLTRISPTHYYTVLGGLQTALGRRARKAANQ